MDEYEIEINGVKHTVQLDAEDAKRYGKHAKKVEPANKSRTAASNKAQGA